MPRQKQSKPKALKQQREEVEQLIRDGETSDLKKPDADSSFKSSRQSAVLSSAGKGKKRHRHKNAMKVKIAKKVHNKRITKALQAKDIPVSKNADIQDSVSNLNPNNNEKPVIELKELDSPKSVAEVGPEAISDSFISDADIVKDKYDMIKERSLQRATKVRQTPSEKDKDIEGSPKKGLDSPKKSPISPLKEPGSHLQRSPTKAEVSAVQLSSKPRHSNSQRKLSEESGRLHSRSLLSQSQPIVKGRQRCVSEGMLTSQETLSKQHALEALLQITGVELHTMSKVPDSEQSVPRTMTTVTSSTPNVPQTSLTGLNKGSMVKISESDRGVVKYHLQSDSLEEQGLKLVYTAQAVGQTNQEQINYSAYRPRKNSTRSNASDSADDPTAKDLQKCCKKPGRHVCQFCGRRCTKPSVLKKHIRSHTGERPYPCSPCGFSFKTKSNLYKHCKTHAHAIKAGLTPNSEELAKLALPDLDEDDSEETESEDEITTCDATTCQTELTVKMSHSDAQMHVGSIPQSGMEPFSRTSQDRNTKGTNIPMMQVPRSLAVVPTIPQQQADSQSNQETVSRHSSWVPTQTSVLPTSNIKMDMPLLSTLLPNQSLRSSNITSVDRPSSAPSASVEFSTTNRSRQDGHHTPESRNDDEVVMSASGASSSQLLKSIVPGELAGFRIDMETRRAIPVLSPQLGTPGLPPTTQSTDEVSSNPNQLLIPLTGFNIVKSGGQYHVQIPVQGISEDSLTMSLDGETGAAIDDTSNGSSLTKGVSKESLQERIQLLISQNRAIVDNTVLESVKPRRTSASRRDSENNSPRIELTAEPPSEGKFQEGRVINPSGYQEFVNPAVRFRRNSLSEAQHPPSVTHGSVAGYPLAGEGNLLERVLKSQQNTAKGPSASDKQILVPLRNLPATKVEPSTRQTGNSGDNRNSIKDLLMQDRPHRLAQIAQHSPVQMSGDSPGGRGSPSMRYIPGSSWPFPQGGESAMHQLRGTLQQQRAAPHAQGLMYPSLYNTPEEVNVSQRICELRGTGRRRKYKSESDVFGEGMPSGPSSPKRRARKIKDMPSVVSPLATSSVQHPSSSMASRTLAEPQKGGDVKPATSPHGHSTSYTGQVSSLPYPSPTAHIATYPTPFTSKSGYSAPYTSHTAITTPGHVTQVQSHMTPMQSHISQMQSHMTSMRSPPTSIPSHMISLGGVLSSVTTSQYQMPRYPSPMMSVPGLISHPGQPTSQVNFQGTYTMQGTPVHVPFRTSVPLTSVTSVCTQSQPVVSEVSVIQHTRMQSKSEPSNKELKLEVSQARDGPHASYPWNYRYPVPMQSPGAASPSSQGLHLLAVASKSPDLSSNLLMGGRKRSFSITEGIQTVRKQEQQIKSPLPNGPPRQMEKHRPSEETNNASPIAMQLLAAVAHGSSYAPRLSPRDQNVNKATSESGVSFQSPSAQPSKRSLSTLQRGNQGTDVSNTEHPLQSVSSIPQQRQVESPKRIKLEQNSASPKSPRCDARTPRSDASRQSPTTVPKVPASRRHLKLDLKSPLTSRMKSPGATDSQKSLLQIDPKSLLTPEALSIAESVMKLASPMKANTPITPVESARELGRLMAHAFHNAGGKVESLITSTQGTMMIGPIATPTPGSGSGSTQYFIIPSPSSSQAPTGFPGPNTLLSPVVSTPSLSLVSPLKSPLATPSVTSQLQGDEAVVCTIVSPHYKRVPPQKPDSHGSFEKQVLRQVKTNSALRQKARYSKLSRSTARNSKITRTTCCCDKRPQPMYVQQGSNRKISMYSNWRTGANFPHPLGISWKAHLGLYDTSRNKKPRFYYVTTSISPPQGGIVTDAAGWKPETATEAPDAPSTHIKQQAINTSTLKPSDTGCTDKSMLESDALKSKEKKVKEASDHNEPSRIQIFSGGYKSNEDYVYVRGRGRGKYVCEECGIRCKKPSMLKKHIRTHTDMRPYQCQICNFAFKTKGNLTKHMKSKAHSKKCTKNGISPSDDSCMEHQFSDAADEDTDSVDGDTTDEDEDEDEDDDISETQSESAVPVGGTVPHRERYSSVPNIQDMPDSLDSQGRPLVWHQYHPGRPKKEQTESQERPRRDSTGSIPPSDSPKSGTASKDDEKQPIKLSRSEVVGKLSRHLTNRHQQSLEKAQKANASAAGKSGDSKDHESSKVFDISQLPPFHASNLLPQPTNPTNVIQPLGSNSDTKPPAPPVLDKYGHIVLTMSTSSTSQYRLSTTIQGSLSSRSKPGTNNGLTSSLTSPTALQISSSNEKQKINTSPRASHHNTESFPAGSPFLQSQVQSAASTVTTSGALYQKDHTPGVVRTPSSLPTASVSQTDVSWAFTFPSHHEPPHTVNVPPGASNLVVGVNPMHSMSNREMHLFPPYVVASEAQPAVGTSPRAYPTNFGVFPHGPRIMSPPFLAGFHDLTRPVTSPGVNSNRPVLQSPTPPIKPQLSPRNNPTSSGLYPSSSGSTQSLPPPIFVEAISDDEDERGSRKRQQVEIQQNKLLVSGSIHPGNSSSSVPSWMSEPGSTIKQLLLARPSLIPPLQENTKFPFFSPFLPPSLASPKLTKSSPIVSLNSSLQPPLVSPMVPSKMMQLPPTILSQVRSPTVQSSSFSLREDHRDSPGPFVPPVARAKSQFQMAPPQSQMHLDKSPSGDQIPVEVAEELVSSPTQSGNHKCSSCNKIFMKPSQLRIHMRIHLEENAFSCPECLLSFPSRILLAKHERSEEHLSKVDAVELPSASTESDPRPFKCKECQIAFRIPGHLAKHLRSRGHRMTLEREGKLPLPKDELLSPDTMSDVEQGDLIIDDSHQPSSPAGSSDKTDSASEGGDMEQMDTS
ncbi:zinc finger protein 40-like isoform X2 [Patiria miniata]|uniref:C2H2-type domain-containing protein n=1 Tax=Patiria miniata TaxID=46514 RepID=A0A913ZK55_PATMI|nr:zinc finger protein 40-like isoform X2 [Patiria miniata]